MEYREFLIGLSAIGIENSDILQILEYLELNGMHWQELLDGSGLDLAKQIFKKSVYSRLCKINDEYVENFIEFCDRENIEILTTEDIFYPESLREIENSPQVLYVKGEIIPEDKNAISIVGARKHSEYAVYATNFFVDQLKNYNVTIVSGMAYGVDAISHRRAIQNNMRTIAVLGSGIDVIYPQKHRGLYEDIINNGAVVSEYPPGTPPNAFRFPLRNRIISGLSKGVIVMEAMKKSGSLITARTAAEQSKEVFAVPGNINSVFSEGTNLLIRDGAKICTSIDDILEEIPSIREFENNVEENFEDFGEDEIEILRELKDGKSDINLIANALNQDISYISTMLTILELKNAVEIVGNKVFLKKADFD